MSALRAQVLARRRRWIASRAVESALVGGGVAALTLAAQRLSGPGDPRAAAAAAALCAALAGAVLLRERWRDERAYAARLDARLGLRGALATACDAERRGAIDRLAALLAARTAAELAASRWRGASSPPAVPFVAALLGGLALLAAVGRPAAPAAWSEVEAALGQVEGLAASATPAEVAAGVARLERALVAAEPTPARERESERRRDAALARLQVRSAAGGAEASGGRAGGASTGPGGGAQGAEPGGSGQAPLAAGAGDRTMSRPEGLPTMQPQSRSLPDAGPDLPRAATWPERHDAVVAGYLELRPRD